MLSRRSFLSRAGLAAASAGTIAAPHIARSADELARKPGQKPKKIIHLVSDGMSVGTLTCANLFSQLTRKRPLTWMQLYQDQGARFGMMKWDPLESTCRHASLSIL